MKIFELNRIKITKLILMFKINVFILAFACVATADTSDIDSFAAKLLCEMTQDCKLVEEKVELHPIVVEGVELPVDAARDKMDEQKFLVRKGVYLTSAGEIRRFIFVEEESLNIERGSLNVNKDSSFMPELNRAPVIIRIPRTSENVK